MLHLALLASLSFQQLSADSLAHADSLRRQQAVEVTPQVLYFTPGQTTATLSFHNPSDTVRQADVRVEFAYRDWPHGDPADTILIASKRAALEPHDTIVLHPGPTDRFAGRWLSGIPTFIKLAPHETKQITITIHVPADTPAGEYWARIATIVRSNDPRHGGQRDEKRRFAVPTKRQAAVIRDTCAVIYRKGPLKMGFAIGKGKQAAIDSANIADMDVGRFSHALWVRLPVTLTGNVPFRGQVHLYYHNVTTGEQIRPDTRQFGLYKDAVLHWAIETDVLSPGQYTLTMKFDNEQAGLSGDQVVPMKPVEVTFHFIVKPAWAY